MSQRRTGHHRVVADAHALPPSIGWIIFRVTPWAVLGPYSHFDDAEWRADSMGPDFVIVYGAREKGVSDFLPMAEPAVY
jgi:hypothetical protein